METTERIHPLISIKNVGKRFNAVEALSNVSFDILPGELHAVMGENGAGKSTLMKILSGVICDYEGELYVDGRQVRFARTNDAEAAGISIIHQELNLVEQLSVAANIFLGREITGPLGTLRWQEMNRQAESLLRSLETNISPDALVGSLRIGDQQLIEIAKALSLKSSILIMDEPTSTLTESEVERLVGVIDSLRQSGVTIIYISHKMEEVFRLADRITVLRDGKFVTTVACKETSPREIAHWMVGRELLHSLDRRGPADGTPALAVRGLSLRWPGHAKPWRLRNISFELRRGEILGLAGLMGSGRTELLECLFGASSSPPEGEILLDDQLHDLRHPADAMRNGIAMVTEDRKRLGLFSHLSVSQNISVCALHQFANLSVLSHRRENAAVVSQIERMSIKCDGPSAAITSLSGGNQQKCILARCMMTNPSVLLLDDPTRGVDIGAKAELYTLMESLANSGMAILVTSSELPELLSVSDRILVLSEGEFVAEFSRAEASEQNIMEAATRSTPISD